MAEANPGVSKDVVSREVLLDLSHEITREWKFVARYLNLEEGIIDRIEKDNENNTPEQIYQMLLAWNQIEGHDATHNVLKQALVKAKRKDLADKLNTYKEECKPFQRPDMGSVFLGNAAYQKEDRQALSVPPSIQLPRSLNNGDPKGSSNSYKSTFELNPKPTTRHDLLAISTKIKNGNPSIYLLKFKETLNNEHRIRKCELGERTLTQEKVIVLLGATGAGKTTLVNCLINDILGVQWEDNFRFQVPEDEEESKQRSLSEAQTKWITSYTMNHMGDFQIPFTITVVDTPGFGDMKGVKRDQEITEQIKTFFTSREGTGIDHIDAIALVTQAPVPRPTPKQKYILDSILALLGKDLSDNIFILATFADGKRPPALEAIKQANIPYVNHFKFNNSALYASNKYHQVNLTGGSCSSTDSDKDEDENNFHSMFWKMGRKSLKTFFQNLNCIQSKSLILTNSVLEERSLLMRYVTDIRKEIQTGLVKLDQLKREADVFKQHEVDIEMNKNFTYNVVEERGRRVNIPVGKYSFNCLNCNFECLYPCSMPNDEQIRRCSVIDNKGHCKVCPSRCEWTVHTSVSYKLEIERVTVTKTYEELKHRYEAAVSRKVNTGKLTKEIIEDFESLQTRIVFYTKSTVGKSFDRLKDIALTSNPLLSVEYIDSLIQSEKFNKLSGFNDRVTQLYDVRNNAEILQCLVRPGYNPFKKYIEMDTSVRDMLGKNADSL